MRDDRVEDREKFLLRTLLVAFQITAGAATSFPFFIMSQTSRVHCIRMWIFFATSNFHRITIMASRDVEIKG